MIFIGVSDRSQIEQRPGPGSTTPAPSAPCRGYGKEVNFGAHLHSSSQSCSYWGKSPSGSGDLERVSLELDDTGGRE